MNFTPEDLKQPPRWLFHEGVIVLAKGNYLVFVIVTREDDTCTVHHQGELFQVAGSQRDAVALCEAQAARWWPSDPKPTPPTETQVVGAKTADGGKVVSTNKYAAPI